MRVLPLLLLAACQPVCEGRLDADGDGRCDGDVADWSEDASIPAGTDRGNVYDLPDDVLEATRRTGLQWAAQWPVTVTGTLIPLDPLRTILDEPSDDPTVETGRALGRAAIGFDSLAELIAWVGAPEAVQGGQGPYFVPTLPPGADQLGVSFVPTPRGDAITFSCGACHTGRLLGRTVVGLTNRRPRSNAFFEFGQRMIAVADPEFLRTLGDATDDEVQMLVDTAEHLDAVGVRLPQTLGLDTSLAQVALSLARRKDDAWASFDGWLQNHPASNGLEVEVADSKPMPWWTLKRKTRWLADGSIVSGNPVHTNFLWNELGRGTDLHALAGWLEEDAAIVEALTVAVFASEPPRWTDFFDPSTVDLQAAERGRLAFDERCAGCHGTYRKGWQDGDPDPLRTTEVRYPERTEVHDVGTDPGRWRGMSHFADRLNALQISQDLQTRVEPQTGYVPPPLDGIWARYPYLHNGSVPSLCALLTPAPQRPSSFVQGPSEVAEDFDATCVGYPVGDAIPAAWDPADTYDTTREGLSNAGHDDMLDGLDATLRHDLVQYLITL